MQNIPKLELFATSRLQYSFMQNDAKLSDTSRLQNRG
jgi:hypothetical protein